MSTSPKLIDLLLSEFQKALRATHNSKWDASHGKPPDHCYVEHATSGRSWTDKSTPISAWMVTLDSIATIPIQTKSPPPKIDGMFFDMCRGFFSVAPDGKAAFISWQTGPRYGRGYKHSIVEESDGSFSLGKGECTWMS